MDNNRVKVTTNSELKVLAFDVFGTVVDWHGSIAAEVIRMKLPVNPLEFATAWRNGYKPAMMRVRSGELPWTKIDHLHRIILDQLLVQFNVTHLDESAKKELNLIWHKLSPWTDTLEGLEKLKSKYTIVTLSNGNLSLLSDMAKNAGLPWDLILSAEVFRHYKPDRETYLGVAEIFDIQPHQVMLCASHKDDLVNANSCGLKTAFIERPLEFGRDYTRDDFNVEEWTNYHATNFLDLAKQLEI